MKTFSLTVPFAGELLVSLDADNEKEALEAAMSLDVGRLRLEGSDAEFFCELGEWGTYHHFTDGWVSRIVTATEVRVDSVEDWGDDE